MDIYGATNILICPYAPSDEQLPKPAAEGSVRYYLPLFLKKVIYYINLENEYP